MRLRRGGKNTKTKKTYRKKGLNDPDKQDDAVTHLQLDILECVVKRALARITVNKASGCDSNPKT